MVILHSNIKDADECITCLPIKSNNLFHINCALVFNECLDYNIPNEELDNIPNVSFVNFSVYAYQGRCATRGIIPSGPSVCIICE